MTKRYDEDIEVTQDPIAPDAPVAFWWRGRRYEIDRRLTAWRDAWGTARDREYVRVQAHPAGSRADGNVDADGFLVSAGAVYDLYRDGVRGMWRLERIWD